jgi:TRAP-type mannitol/chloroaromatic compound transport system substrate-binding protein
MAAQQQPPSQPIYRDEFNDRLDCMTVKYMSYIHTLQDGLVTQMLVDKRDLQLAIDALRAEMREAVGELRTEMQAKYDDLNRRYQALEALVTAQTQIIQEVLVHQRELRAYMDARARDTETIIADAVASLSEQINEVRRRLPPEEQAE